MKKNHLLFYSILITFLTLLNFAKGSTEEMADKMKMSSILMLQK